MFALFWLVGCGPSIDSDDTEPGVDPAPGNTPSLVILTPEVGPAIAGSTAQVTGTATVQTVLVNGLQAAVEAGTWSSSQPLTPGLNTFEVTAEDGSLRDIRSAIAGDMQAPTGFVEGAVQLHLGADVLSSLPLDGLLNPADLEAQLQALNPVLDTGDVQVGIGSLTFGAVDVGLVPADGVLDVVLVAHDLALLLTIDGAPLGIDEAEVNGDALVVQLGLTLGTDSGQLTAGVVDAGVSFENFDFDLDNWLINLFISDGDIEELLLEEIDGMLPGLSDTLDEALAGIDLTQELELLDQNLVVEPRFAHAGITPDGIDLGLDLAIDVDGVSNGGGHLVVGGAPTVAGDGVGIRLADDVMNRFLHEIWAAGGLDLALEVAGTDAADLLLQQAGGLAGTGGSLALSAALPPVWVERDGAARLQLGEVDLTLSTPGGLYGDSVQFKMALDAGASLVVGETVGVQIAGAQVKLVPVGASANEQALLDKIGQIEVTLGFGLGALNDLLSFPLELPEMAVERDVRSTALQLDGDAIYTLITGEDPPLPPAPPHPLDPQGAGLVQPIPAVVTVLDDDVDLADDGTSAFICSRDEVSTTGADGTWYLERRAELTVQGTGHVIYAERQTVVTLEADGNIVVADPDAEIHDLTGANTVFYADPLDLDDAAVPDGC